MSVNHRIIRSDDLRLENRHRVLRALRHSGQTSRTELSEQTGLSPASVSNLVSLLHDQGIVRDAPHTGESAPSRTRRGRPKTALMLSGKAATAATVEMTIDRLRLRLIDYTGHTLVELNRHFDSRASDEASLLAMIDASIETLCESSDLSALHHIAIGVQGVTEHQTGTVLWTPILSVENIAVGRHLSDRFEVPVTVHNDCRLIAGALHHARQTELGDSFVAVLFSHGVGMGLYLNGQSFTGTQSSALEFGHIRHQTDGALCRCGQRGCIEAYSADYGIDRLARGLPPHSEPAGRVDEHRVDDIASAALDGDDAARNALRAAGTAIGRGLGSVFTLLEPMPVALVGHSQRALELMQDSVLDALGNNQYRQAALEPLVHLYSDDETLLQQGLVLDALTHLDHHMAYLTEDAVT